MRAQETGFDEAGGLGGWLFETDLSAAEGLFLNEGEEGEEGEESAKLAGRWWTGPRLPDLGLERRSTVSGSGCLTHL